MRDYTWITDVQQYCDTHYMYVHMCMSDVMMQLCMVDPFHWLLYIHQTS